MSRRVFAGVCVMIVAFGVASTAWADQNSNGPNGTNATATGLTGAGVVLGQLEGGRPASAIVDTNANVNGLVTVTGLYMATTPLPANGAFQNFDQSSHAEGVAGTIISTGVASGGAATGATLYSGDIFSNSTQTINVAAGDYRNAILTGQRLDTTAGMKAVNMSFGFRYGAANLNDFTGFDGTNQFTQYVDWSASRYNVVNVTAGNETGGSLGADVPTDSYNGIVVSASTTGGDGRYTTTAGFNIVSRLPSGGRLSTVDIMAPGDNLTLPTLGNNNIVAGQAGTSFAAPQVAAAVGLLSQEATTQNMGNDGQQHNVSKAVLMNSADKVQGILGMDRTITRNITRNNTDTGNDPNSNTNNWLQQRDLEVANTINRNTNPLDTQMGTGELNDVRAKTQLDAGEQKPGNVNYIGWDYNNVTVAGQQNHYTLPTLSDGAWVSATLSWDRKITLNDTVVANNSYDAETYIDLGGGTNNVYDAGEPLNDTNGNGTFQNLSESFSVNGLNDLDLYLVPVGDTTMADYINISAFAASDSTDYSVEHLFFQVPDAGNYDLVVQGLNLDFGAQDYGFAWWTEVPEPTSVTLLVAGAAMILARRRRAA